MFKFPGGKIKSIFFRSQNIQLKNEVHNLSQRTFMVVQWLSLYVPNVRAWGWIPGQENRSHAVTKTSSAISKDSESRN